MGRGQDSYRLGLALFGAGQLHKKQQQIEKEK